MHGRVTADRKAVNKARKALVCFAVVFVCGGAWNFLAQLYFVRELFVFVVIAALLVCTGAVVVLTGILLQEAALALKRYIRGAQPIALAEWTVRKRLGPEGLK